MSSVYKRGEINFTGAVSSSSLHNLKKLKIEAARISDQVEPKKVGLEIVQVKHVSNFEKQLCYMSCCI